MIAYCGNEVIWNDPPAYHHATFFMRWLAMQALCHSEFEWCLLLIYYFTCLLVYNYLLIQILHPPRNSLQKRRERLPQMRQQHLSYHFTYLILSLTRKEILKHLDQNHHRPRQLCSDLMYFLYLFFRQRMFPYWIWDWLSRQLALHYLHLSRQLNSDFHLDKYHYLRKYPCLEVFMYVLLPPYPKSLCASLRIPVLQNNCVRQRL